MGLRNQLESEAAAARAALPHLTDAAVSETLAHAAGLVRERAGRVLAANQLDYEAAAERLDPGTLDRLRLDESRIEALVSQLGDMASLPALERAGNSWRLSNGLEAAERRIPIGVVGANFEARPNVALDVAGQLLKSLNCAVLRTGGAALRTVTVLVDEILRPALEQAGLPPGAVGLVRSSDREGARLLVSLPQLIPLVILRGSGESTASLARLAAEHGVRALAHAEGGGVLYIHRSAERDTAIRLIEQSLDRLGVCNRLNLLLIDQGALPMASDLVRNLQTLGIDVRTSALASEHGVVGNPLDVEIGHEWANDSERVATVTVQVVESVGEAAGIANDETSGLAASIVAEDAVAAEEFLDGYRGTAAFWNASTRLTDGYALTDAPETGINVDWSPGPRGPVTYRDLWLRQYRVVGNGSESR
ncbi:MAG: aldehyde dehydrogenase family protein [Gaiellaceae bacterium]